MKVYIADRYKIEDYSLPNKVEDSFLITYISSTGVEENITLVAENGKWTISSNYDVSIIKSGVSVSKEIIKDNDFYQIKFSDLEEIINIYCFEVPTTYYNYSISNKEKITLGRSNADLLYENVNVGSPHFEIVKSNGYWILKDNGSDSIITFVNGKRYHQFVLNLGDVIFVHGLKIIWMDTFIKINNPNNAVKTSLGKHESFKMFGTENKYTPVKETEKGIVLFNDNQLFFHTPRLRSSIEEKEIKIVNPPDKEKDDGPPAILTLGASMMMGISSSITGIITIFNAISGKSNLLKTLSEIVICLSMILGTLLIPVLLNRFQKSRIKKKEKNRQKKYSMYLEEKRKEISDEISKQTKILNENYLTLEQIKKNVIEKNNYVWNRELSDSDFLTVRLGIGTKKANIKIKSQLEEFSLDDDNLKDQVETIVNTPLIMNNVPITVSLVENRVLPLIINNTYSKKQFFINSIMLQLISYYSGKDLKIIVITDENHKSSWEYLKFLPHCCSDDFSTHFFATNEEEMKSLAGFLEQEYNTRLENFSKNENNEEKKIENQNRNMAYLSFEKYYLIITDNYISAKKIKVIDRIINSTLNLGFSLLMIEPTMKNIPSKADKFIEINEANGIISTKDLNDENKNIFIPEVENTDISNYSEILSNIPILSKKDSSSLPTSLNFLEMYKVGKIEQLNILNRWLKNDPTISLSTPLGVNEEGKLFTIDLHEKFHGPHGLIAGATGSGKSEFIITFILSMAINYHPYEVQFVLIDYKGGGLAGAFENRETGVKIPHLIGTITNLDESEMNRTLVSINSELKRRQRAFNEARDSLGESTVDIYKYQQLYREGKVKEPISHLFIISDEFAELKSQQPEFMDQLVSTARIGRSLGVHLILATQKPSGVVNDQIWSNSRFKVCLKVQTAEDSNELLKRPEAASIKETGRFYLQIGYNESFELGQSAWAGAKYNPTDRIIKNIDDSIDFISNDGNIIKKVNDKVQKEQQKDYGDQLTNIVKTLYDISNRENIEFKNLWLPSIPKDIYLANIINKYKFSSNPYQIECIIGEYDDPANQFQDIFKVNLNNGHVYIFGNPGSGKENMLMSMIYSACIYHTSEEVNFYILDFGAETLKVYKNMPHVGDIITVDEKNKVNSLFVMIERQINIRKELFSEFGGNYDSYIKNSGKTLPLIVIALNNYESFLENYNTQNEYFIHQIRDCAKYGIIYILTAVAANSVNGRVKQLFSTKIATQLNDVFDYNYELHAPHGLKPAKFFGRGVAEIKSSAYEFQTANVYLADQINDVIKDTSSKLSNTMKKANKIPVIPETITSETMLPYIDDVTNIPLGYDIYTADIEKYNFVNDKCNYIIGNSLLTETDFTKELIEVLNSVPSIKLRIIDFANSLNNIGNVEYYNGDFTNTIKSIIAEEKSAISTTVYMLIGTSYIKDKVLDEGVEMFEKIFSNLDQYKNSYFILIDNYSSIKKVLKDNWCKTSFDKNSGIWIGTGIDIQTIFTINNLTKNDSSEDFNGLAFSISNKKARIIKTFSKKGSDYY